MLEQLVADEEPIDLYEAEGEEAFRILERSILKIWSAADAETDSLVVRRLDRLAEALGDYRAAFFATLRPGIGVDELNALVRRGKSTATLAHLALLDPCREARLSSGPPRRR